MRQFFGWRANTVELPGLLVPYYMSFGPLTPIVCPYCGGKLNWTPDLWLEAFECRRCGPFSDFGSAPSTRRDSSAASPYTAMVRAARPGVSDRSAYRREFRRLKAQRNKHGVIAPLELDVLHDERVFAAAADLLQRGSMPGTTSPPPHRTRSAGFINSSASAGSFTASRRFHTGSAKEALTFL